MSLLRSCIECGELSEKARCQLHRPAEPPKATATQRGYDSTWSRLSLRARAAQPFCTDCLTTEDLTADHSPAAWERKEKGLAIRLEDVSVVCRSCNSKRGAARGGEETPINFTKNPVSKAKSQLLSANHYQLGGK